jgi:steroid 5-alpha reductase family enzyme
MEEGNMWKDRGGRLNRPARLGVLVLIFLGMLAACVVSYLPYGRGWPSRVDVSWGLLSPGVVGRYYALQLWRTPENVFADCVGSGALWGAYLALFIAMMGWLVTGGPRWRNVLIACVACWLLSLVVFHVFVIPGIAEAIG